MKFAFFGTSEFSVYVLEELKKHDIVPNLIVASSDKPKGRKLIITPPPTKIWAEKNNIPVYQPKSLRSLKKDGTPFKEPAKKVLEKTKWNLFLVASYGKIIPAEIFNIPTHKTLNIHPSLLPKYRGASPIQSQILNDFANPDRSGGEKNVGVTLMQIDEGMDTGPIILQENTQLDEWPIGSLELEKTLAVQGAKMFAQILPDWLEDKIKPNKQDDSKATECGKIEKSDGEIDLNGDPYKNYLKIKAYEGWPGTYFFKYGKRIKITEAEFKEDTLVITRVIPEGKKDMDYKDFIKNFKTLKP